MLIVNLLKGGAIAALSLAVLAASPPSLSIAQDQTAAAAPSAPQAPEPLSADEMEVLVARIALYPDELVALISAAALYPLQIVDAARYLEKYAKDKSLKPKDSWDGSVISLLNYPEIVKMMSDDLDWTESFGDAITYQQKDVLVAIQQLRDEAVAKGIIKSDDKIKVVTQNDNVIIQPASTEKIYVPQYEPQMLYDPGYAPAPIGYYAEPYPYYWSPTATFFAAAATGALFAAAVNWDDWGVWGGRWNGGDIDVDCNRCFNNNNFNGKMNFNDVDWRNVDRSKIKMDKNQIAKLDRTNIGDRVRADNNNALRNRTTEIKNNRAANLQNRGQKVNDVRKSTLEGLKQNPGAAAKARQNIQKPANRPKAGNAGQARQNVAKAGNKRPANVNRPAGKPKAAARIDHRPRSPSGLGNVDRGRASQMHSARGRQSMGGGYRGGGAAMHRGGGGGRGAIHRGGGGGRRR